MTETSWFVFGATMVASLAFVIGYGFGKAMEIRRRDRNSVHVGDMSDRRPEAISCSYYDKSQGLIVHIRNDGQKVTE